MPKRILTRCHEQIQKIEANSYQCEVECCEKEYNSMSESEVLFYFFISASFSLEFCKRSEITSSRKMSLEEF